MLLQMPSDFTLPSYTRNVSSIRSELQNQRACPLCPNVDVCVCVHASVFVCKQTAEQRKEMFKLNAPKTSTL